MQVGLVPMPHGHDLMVAGSFAVCGLLAWLVHWSKDRAACCGFHCSRAGRFYHLLRLLCWQCSWALACPLVERIYRLTLILEDLVLHLWPGTLVVNAGKPIGKRA